MERLEAGTLVRLLSYHPRGPDNGVVVGHRNRGPTSFKYILQLDKTQGFVTTGAMITVPIKVTKKGVA